MAKLKKFRQPKHLLSSLFITLLAGLMVFFVVQQAVAGPITGGAGNAPYAKLSVYQGVISVVPNGSGDSVMEIGNAGRDIASTGDINLRPGSVSTGFARFYKDAAVANKVSLDIPGNLCLGGVCNSSWPAVAASPVIKHVVGNLSAVTTQAKRFEVARIGYDSINWSTNSSVFVELFQKFWDAGGYKKYEVRAGYTDDGSYRLIEATGTPTVMSEARVQIGSPVVVSGTLAYLPVYVDVDYYTNWDVIISHNMAETANAVPTVSQLKIFDAPAGTNIASFVENDIVTNEYPRYLNNNLTVGNYNLVTQQGDSGLFFPSASGLTIGGWNSTLRKGIRIGGGTDPLAGATLAVNNLANFSALGLGGSDDGVAAFSDAHNQTTGAPHGSAIYGEQKAGGSGYAGYFTNGPAGAGSNSATPVSTFYAENLYQAPFTASTAVDANAAFFRGDVEIRQKGVDMPNSIDTAGWPEGDILKIVGNSGAPAPGGFLVDVRNYGTNGYAAAFLGQVVIRGATSIYGNTEVRGTSKRSGNINNPQVLDTPAVIIVSGVNSCSAACVTSGLTCGMAYQTAGGTASCASTNIGNIFCICY